MDSTDSPGPVLCPRCRVELGMQDIFPGGRHATVGACPSCGGMWMRDSDLERLSEVVRPVLVEWRRLAPDEYQSTALDCPECEGPIPMRKVRSSRDARVVLDHCDHCGGVWLDGNELRAIQEDSLLALAADFWRSTTGEQPPASDQPVRE